MRLVVLSACVLLAGCVQQAYVPPPIELQPYPPPVTYRIDPLYRPPSPPPLAEPLPPLGPTNESPEAVGPVPSDNTGAIPLQQMPAPAPDVPARSDTDTNPAPAPAAPVVARAPTAGPGSNVPLEGFRPMHSQTRPAP